MFIDKDGDVNKSTDVYDNGMPIVHHHSTEKLTPEQNIRFSEIISRKQDSLPKYKQLKIIDKFKSKEN